MAIIVIPIGSSICIWIGICTNNCTNNCIHNCIHSSVQGEEDDKRRHLSKKELHRPFPPDAVAIGPRGGGISRTANTRTSHLPQSSSPPKPPRNHPSAPRQILLLLPNNTPPPILRGHPLHRLPPPPAPPPSPKPHHGHPPVRPSLLPRHRRRRRRSALPRPPHARSRLQHLSLLPKSSSGIESGVLHHEGVLFPVEGVEEPGERRGVDVRAGPASVGVVEGVQALREAQGNGGFAGLFADCG
mmetsp:Transcript_25454/g.50829  ORF Transcript_25454/g.50829 Transcript_25454/m.50829 type:complete len:243 (+) Transcript_25454:108-836(+)